MKNPFGNQQIPGSYHNLKERIYRKVSVNISEQIWGILQREFENAISEENVLLSRLERQRLFLQIIKMIMEDMLGKTK